MLSDLEARLKEVLSLAQESQEGMGGLKADILESLKKVQSSKQARKRYEGQLSVRGALLDKEG